MKLTFLGTAAAEGWPALFCNCPGCLKARELKGKNIRTRSQSLVNDDLLLDFPPDTYLHVLNYGLDLNKVKDVLITHTHEDHLYMPDLAVRQPGYTMHREPHMLNLFGNDAVVREYEHSVSSMYNTELPSVVAIKELTEYKPAQVGAYTVYPMLADHNKAEKCFIYLIRDKDGKTLLYAHDTGYLRDEIWDFLKDFHLDIVSLDCNHGKVETSRNHMGMECCGRVKQRLLDEGIADEKTIFIANHFSHNSHYIDFSEIEAHAAQYGMIVSYDGRTVEA